MGPTKATAYVVGGFALALLFFGGLLWSSGALRAADASPLVSPAPAVELVTLKDGSAFAGTILEENGSVLKIGQAVALRQKPAPEGTAEKSGDVDLIPLAKTELRTTGVVTISRELVGLRQPLQADSPVTKAVLGQ